MTIYITYLVYVIIAIWVYRVLAFFYDSDTDSSREIKSRRK
ncbi:hypothetical protein [Chitinophaga defluvii]|uniref:CcmD family protein n=1 Tax=Chitinophaga defluvii TaxID=3163343 RepID=A0ABV2T5G0_9BACT